MPAFAPVLRPGDLAVADGGEGMEGDFAVGVEVGEDEDEDVVAAGTEADHVVAGRSDLWWCLQFSGCFCM